MSEGAGHWWYGVVALVVTFVWVAIEIMNQKREGNCPECGAARSELEQGYDTCWTCRESARRGQYHPRRIDES